MPAPPRASCMRLATGSWTTLIDACAQTSVEERLRSSKRAGKSSIRRGLSRGHVYPEHLLPSRQQPGSSLRHLSPCGMAAPRRSSVWFWFTAILLLVPSRRRRLFKWEGRGLQGRGGALRRGRRLWRRNPGVEWAAVTRGAVTGQGRRAWVRKRGVFVELASPLEQGGAEGWVTSLCHVRPTASLGLARG